MNANKRSGIRCRASLLLMALIFTSVFMATSQAANVEYELYLNPLAPKTSLAEFEFPLSEEPTPKLFSTQLHIVVPEEGKRIINTSFNWTHRIITRKDKAEADYWFLLAH